MVAMLLLYILNGRYDGSELLVDLQPENIVREINWQYIHTY